MRRPLSVALLAATVAIGAGLAMLTPAGAEPVFPLGSRVGLEPPGNLVVSRRFSGFEDLDRKVAVVILDLPAGAYEDIERSAFANALPGLSDVKRQSFAFASGFGFLVDGQASPDGVVLHKTFLLATTPGFDLKNITVLVNVEVPDAARAVYSDAVIRKMLASVTLRPTPVQEQLGLLPFKVNEFAGLRVVQTLAEGGVILTAGPTDNINAQPYMLITVGPGAPSEPGDREKFVRDMLATAPMRDLTVTVADPMRIGGVPGFELRAQATGLDGAALNLVQWVRFGSGGFLRIIGVSRREEWDTFFTRFRAVRDGIEMR